MGMVAACRLGSMRGPFPPEQTDWLQALLQSLGLATSLPRMEPERYLEAMRSDKKVRSGRIRFVTPVEIGRVEVRDDIGESIVIDALEAVGGQCLALYPEKPIYDIPGYPEISAGDLIRRLEAQAKPFGPVYHLGQRVEAVTADGGEGWLTSYFTLVRSVASPEGFERHVHEGTYTFTFVRLEQGWRIKKMVVDTEIGHDRGYNPAASEQSEASAT